MVKKLNRRKIPMMTNQYPTTTGLLPSRTLGARKGVSVPIFTTILCSSPWTSALLVVSMMAEPTRRAPLASLVRWEGPKDRDSTALHPLMFNLHLPTEHHLPTACSPSTANPSMLNHLPTAPLATASLST